MAGNTLPVSDEVEPRGFNVTDAARYCGASVSQLNKARIDPSITGPKFRRFGGRIIYVREDLDAFLDSL